MSSIMELRDEHIPEDLFAACLERLPEACVEIVVEHDGAALVARRTNDPARGEWFWPGGRLYKGESTTAGARRVARGELGLDVELTDLLGVYDHFWESSRVSGVDSRHTVNVVYRVRPTATPVEVVLDEQHDAFRFVDDPVPELHEHVNTYLLDAGYGGTS